MPFTFAHPAAVLPLRRYRFLLSLPLLIGSVVPDVPDYFPHRLARMLTDTHTFYGSIVICLPLGMAMLVGALLLREPLTVLLGARARSACLGAAERFGARPLHWLIALLSLLVGIWSHIAWDSFTHQDGWATEHVAALRTPVSLFEWDTSVYHLLQYLSSIFGLVIVGLWVRAVLRRTPAQGDVLPPRVRTPILLMVFSVAIIAGLFLTWRQWYVATYYHLGYLMLTRTIAWFATLYLGAGLVVTFNRRAVFELAR
jgi:Domain of unknown function (DUF4184)